MSTEECEHLYQVYLYVFSVPPGTERDRRLVEISKEDNAKLYDFDMGLLSGRIKKPENQSKESEEQNMETKKISSYADFKSAWSRTSNYHRLAAFHRDFPEVYEDYMERMEREKLKAKDPVGYLLKYGNSAREV